MKKARLEQTAGKLGIAGYEVWHHMFVKSKQYMVGWLVLIHLGQFLCM